MTDHRKLAKTIAQELYQSSRVQALILYGSVSRQEESANSDIDLLAIVNENYLQKRHEIRCGIIVEYVEMSFAVLKDFITQREIPMLFAVAKGSVLFDKTATLSPLITEAARILQSGPPVQAKWQDPGYATKKRSELTEIYWDLLDVQDVTAFHYLVSLLITAAIPCLIETHTLWPQTRKKR